MDLFYFPFHVCVSFPSSSSCEAPLRLLISEIYFYSLSENGFSIEVSWGMNSVLGGALTHWVGLPATLKTPGQSEGPTAHFLLGDASHLTDPQRPSSLISPLFANKCSHPALLLIPPRFFANTVSHPALLLLAHSIKNIP